MADVQEDIEALDKKLEHVLEPEMRRALVLEWLLDAGPERAYAVVAGVVRGPAQFETLRAAVCELLALPRPEGPSAVSYELRRDLYARASEAGDEDVMRFLRSLPARESLDEPGRLLPRDLQEIPLGRRRSLAKGLQRDLLEQLARDPDPVVIRNLLVNPRVTEADVLRMAALRPVAASTLVEIARSRRWSVRPRIRIALARNPWSPVDVALRMVASLTRADLLEMRADPDLHPATKAQVQAELARR